MQYLVLDLISLTEYSHWIEDIYSYMYFLYMYF